MLAMFRNITSTLKRLRDAPRWEGLSRKGRQGEKAAIRYLRRSGYRVLGCNLHNKFGEVDILAEAPDGRTVVIVEVKSRALPRDTQPNYAQKLVLPEARVGSRKQRRLVALAGQMARRYRLADRPIRFDVVGVDLQPGTAPVIRHHPGAFESHV